MCFYLVCVGLQYLGTSTRRVRYDDFFPSFHSAYRKRLRLIVRVTYGGRNCCKKLILHRTVEESCRRYSNIIIKIIIYCNIILCACIRKTRVRESLESVRERATMNRLWWCWQGRGGGSRIANGVVVVVDGVNGNIFPFNESPGAYSVTGTGRDVIPAERVRRGTGTRPVARGVFAFSPARAPPPPPPSPPAPVARARVSTVRRSRARCTRRGGSVCFSASF